MSTNIPKNLDFSSSLRWDGGTGALITLEGHHPLKIDALPEFGGDGREPCPDELFLAALGGCLLTTFLYTGRKLRVPFAGLEVSVRGRVRLGLKGYELFYVKANIRLETPEGCEATAQECVQLTRRYCHLTRLIEDNVTFELTSEIISKPSNTQ